MMQMARKMALLDFNKCSPTECGDGICAASGACSLKLFRQEEPYSVPLTEPSFCRACGDCVRACPLNAVQIVST